LNRTVVLASDDWEVADEAEVRFVAFGVGGSIGGNTAPADLKCLFHVPSQPRLPSAVPYGILSHVKGGFLKKRISYQHVLNHQLMPDAWQSEAECEMSLNNAVNIVGDKLFSGRGEHFDLTVTDGDQIFDATHQYFSANYYAEPTMMGQDVVRAVIYSADIDFEPVPVIISGSMRGTQEHWEIRIPGWLDTIAVMSGQRQVQEAADGLTYLIGYAVVGAVMAQHRPNDPSIVINARQRVGLVTNLGRMYSGLEPQQIR